MTKISLPYRFTAFLLATLMFFTSSGFVLGKHQCKMEQKSMQETVNLACNETGCQKGCCSTELEYFKLDQDQQTAHAEFQLTDELSQFITVFASVFMFTSAVQETKTPKYFLYKPPLIRKDIPVLIQSFLL
ncbi:MAG: hypothetical protein P1U70_06970 [Saprospiraceae bacterium]|jgi:hypothetical protein|nr:hypothetical protein [Saprospiraceae bacterium]